MKEKQYKEEQAGRRLRKTVDGPMIEKWYARRSGNGSFVRHEKQEGDECRRRFFVISRMSQKNRPFCYILIY